MYLLSRICLHTIFPQKIVNKHISTLLTYTFRFLRMFEQNHKDKNKDTEKRRVTFCFAIQGTSIKQNICKLI